MMNFDWSSREPAYQLRADAVPRVTRIKADVHCLTNNHSVSAYTVSLSFSCAYRALTPCPP